MLSLREALGLLAGAHGKDRPITLAILSPPYACAGTGCLRVARVAEGSDSIALTAVYEGYERL